MFRCHFTLKPLFWNPFIQGTPSFKSHIVSPLPPQASSCNLFISYLYWMGTSIQGTSVLILRLSSEWKNLKMRVFGTPKRPICGGEENRDFMWKIINNYWTRLSKISWFVCREQTNFDPRDTDKSRYFAIREFNNCFIIRSPSLFF